MLSRSFFHHARQMQMCRFPSIKAAGTSRFHSTGEEKVYQNKSMSCIAASLHHCIMMTLSSKWLPNKSNDFVGFNHRNETILFKDLFTFISIKQPFDLTQLNDILCFSLV